MDYPNSLVGYQLHFNDDYSVPWCAARADFYGVVGIPEVWIDGVLFHYDDHGGDQANYDNMLSLMSARWDVPTDVTIEIGGEQTGEQSGAVVARLAVEEGGAPKPVRVYMVQVLDYYPEGEQYRNCLMQAGPTWDLTLAPGEARMVAHQFQFDDVSWADKDNIRILVWVQDPLNIAPAEVHQAEMMAWPFSPLNECAGDIDGSGSVGTADLLALLGAWGTSGGPEDINGDGIVNTADLLLLLGAWGPCPTGACCLWDETCMDTTEYECLVAGFSQWYEGEECANFQCPEPATGACCIGTDCIATNTEYDCYLAGGAWHEGEDCADFVCQWTYCDAGGGCDEHITNVTVGDIDNTTGCDEYGDYSDLSTDMAIGNDYDIAVTLGSAYPSDRGGLWIDWNRDGYFEGADEEITIEWFGYGPYNAVITPPPDAVPGPTRMRVRLTFAVVPTPCGWDSYGEVEDYTINVLPPPRR